MNRNLCFLVIFFFYFNQSTSDSPDSREAVFLKDPERYLVIASYKLTKKNFELDRLNYENMKNTALRSFEEFHKFIMTVNDVLSRELRSAIMKLYKIKYLRDFLNGWITLDEAVGIVDHCLADPLQRNIELSERFKKMIQNFNDVRNFDLVFKCANQLPDEVSVSNCIIHQAIQFNITMQDNLMVIIEIKIGQFAEEVKEVMYDVNKCFEAMIPNFFSQVLMTTYSPECQLLELVGTVCEDFGHEEWVSNQSYFLKTWGSSFEELQKQPTHSSKLEFLTLLGAKFK